MKNLLILTYWSYKDALIQTYTLPYIRIIRKNLPPEKKIYLFTMEQSFHKMNDSEWSNEKKNLLSENIHLIRVKYSSFGLEMIIKFFSIFISLFFLILTKRISHIHAWCTPAGAIGYILSVITFRPLIIDSYEPHADSMVENGEWKKNSIAFKILFWFEKKMSRKAKTVIALTEGMKEYAKKRYNTTFKNYYVKPSLVDLEKFSFDTQKDEELIKKYNLTGKIVCLYAGKLGGIYLDNEVFELFHEAYKYWKKDLKILLLTNKDKKQVVRLIKQHNIPENIIEVLFVDYSNIHKYYRLADFAINPVKPVPSKRFCTSIKDGEYWAMGLPVIITKDISDDSDIIEKNNIGAVIQSLDKKGYHEAIKKIDDLLNTDRNKLQKKIISIAIKYRGFHIAENIYKEIYGKK